MADTTRSGADGHDARGLLIRELNHRAKNMLQSISAILSLEASRAPNDEARAALHRAMERVRSMAAVQTLLYDGASGGVTQSNNAQTTNTAQNAQTTNQDTTLEIGRISIYRQPS